MYGSKLLVVITCASAISRIGLPWGEKGCMSVLRRKKNEKKKADLRSKAGELKGGEGGQLAHLWVSASLRLLGLAMTS